MALFFAMRGGLGQMRKQTRFAPHLFLSAVFFTYGTATL
jgi:hypothetical protein